MGIVCNLAVFKLPSDYAANLIQGGAHTPPLSQVELEIKELRGAAGKVKNLEHPDLAKRQLDSTIQMLRKLRSDFAYAGAFAQSGCGNYGHSHKSCKMMREMALVHMPMPGDLSLVLHAGGGRGPSL